MAMTPDTRPTPSPRSDARMAGALYLVNIIVGMLVIGVIPSLLIVRGAPAATVDRLVANELLHRIGVAGHVVVIATNIPLAVLFYELFRVVSRRGAMVIASFLLVGAAVEAAGLPAQFVPLIVANGVTAGASFTPGQLQALAAVPLAAQTVTYSISAVFFAGYGITIGLLIRRSTFLPRPVGLLMIAAGAAYLTYSFATFVAPSFAASLVPAIQLPSLVGEGALCLSLLAGRLDVGAWRRAATSATSALPTGALPAD